MLSRLRFLAGAGQAAAGVAMSDQPRGFGLNIAGAQRTVVNGYRDVTFADYSSQNPATGIVRINLPGAVFVTAENLSPYLYWIDFVNPGATTPLRFYLRRNQSRSFALPFVCQQALLYYLHHMPSADANLGNLSFPNEEPRWPEQPAAFGSSVSPLLVRLTYSDTPMAVVDADYTAPDQRPNTFFTLAVGATQFTNTDPANPAVLVGTMDITRLLVANSSAASFTVTTNPYGAGLSGSLVVPPNTPLTQIDVVTGQIGVSPALIAGQTVIAGFRWT